jgi:hypothetical protein
MLRDYYDRRVLVNRFYSILEKLSIVSHSNPLVRLSIVNKYS